MKRVNRTVRADALNSITVTKKFAEGYELAFKSYKETTVATTTNHIIQLDEWDLKTLIEEILKAIDSKQEMFERDMQLLRNALRYSTTKAKIVYERPPES